MVPATSPWVAAATGGNLGPKVYRGDSAGFVCSDLLSPVMTLDALMLVGGRPSA